MPPTPATTSSTVPTGGPRRERGERPFFERNWPDFLTGAIFDSRV